jgi:transcriptional regulator with XRE-family HTH domain
VRDRGAAIRARRESLGLTLDAVASATRISVAHLEALEEDRLDDLPPGPYAGAYLRAVCHELGLDDPLELGDDITPIPAEPPQGAPLWLVRALAGLSLLALLALLASLAWERVGPSLAMPVARAPDQHLRVAAQRPTRLRVEVDGEPALDRRVERGEKLSFHAADRLAIRVEATSHVRLEWNGAVLVPQGRQDVPRELVFVDDRGLGW